MEKQINEIIIELKHEEMLSLDESYLDKYYNYYDEKNYLENGFDAIYDNLFAFYLNYNHLCFWDDKFIKNYKRLLIHILNEEDEKNKNKLIPLIACIDKNSDLCRYLFSIEYFSFFTDIEKDKFAEILVRYKEKIDLSNIPVYYDVESLKSKYKIYLENKNLSLIYDFISSYENIKFTLPSSLISIISYLYFKIARNKFIEIIDKKDFLTIKNILREFNTIEKLKVAEKSNSILVKFYVITSLVYIIGINKKENFTDEENSILSKLIIDISIDKFCWDNFLRFILSFPSRSPKIFLPMAKSLDRISYELIDVFCEEIRIIKSYNNEDKTILDTTFFNMKNSEKQKYIFEKLFMRWQLFIKNYDDYLGGILFTDIDNAVIMYIHEFMEFNEIKKKIEKCINNLTEIDNKWFKNGSEMDNYFNRQITELFIYLISAEKYDTKKYKEELKNIFKKRGLYLIEEKRHNQKSIIELFNQYVFNKIILYDEKYDKDIPILFTNTIHKTCYKDYTQEQLDAWANLNIDFKYWKKRVNKTKPYLAVFNDKLVGFAEFENDYIDCFYVHHEYQGQGVGKALMANIFDEAYKNRIKIIKVDASITSKSFFESFGFVEVKQNIIERGMQQLINYSLELKVNV